MSQLTASTRRRLSKLPQIASVWEGDCRPIPTGVSATLMAEPAEGSCVLWVDGSQGVVRAMDVVNSPAKYEIMVRNLLQAMESPHSAAPARPQKIVVNDREFQFYLRGILQDLSIKVEFQAELPFIDEVYRSIIDMSRHRRPRLPEAYADELTARALTLWQDVPWTYIADHQIIAIEVNQWDISTLYASVMGMLGMEFGILLYRSLDSLRQFRQQAVEQDDESLEGAFLSQDCFYLTFEMEMEHSSNAVEPSFGLIHPLEGIRTQLYEEEALGLIVALDALHRFFKAHRRQLTSEFVALSKRYSIENPQDPDTRVSVQVSTLLDVTEEFAEQWDDDDDEPGGLVLHEDLTPAGSLVGLSVIPWSTVDTVNSTFAEGEEFKELCRDESGLPVVVIQTSRPKAKALITKLQGSCKPAQFCFNEGTEAYGDKEYDLKVMQATDEELYLLGESLAQEAYFKLRQAWERQCDACGGFCGLLVAMGVTAARGSARGGEIPERYMLAIFPMRKIDPKVIGLEPLVKMPIPSLEF